MLVKKTKLFVMISALFLIILSACNGDTPPVVLTIDFDTNGGNKIDDIYVEIGKTVTLPLPEKEGHNFIGWFTGDGANDIKYSNYVPVLENLTLYAKWEINQYTMNFDSDGGSLVSPITQDFDSDIYVSEPSKEGYTFLGWHPEVPSTMPAGDLTFTAQWQINQYHVTYVFVSSDYNSLQNILLNLGEKITKVSLYNSHSSAITSEGRLFTWGENWEGSLAMVQP